jgi:glycosyltransferase involved in cell wall biosynthesis
MSVPRVTIGVPVRNGEAGLENCLACLSGQTYTDIEILISDNDSTDRTAEIVQAAMRRDPRIKYIRQKSNLGALANFSFTLNASQSPYFMWRAFDDLSNDIYVERLAAALDTHPDAVIAAPRSETLRVKMNKRRVRLPPIPGEGPTERCSAERWILRRLQAGWFYGLYRRSFLLDAMAFVEKNYHHVWAWDFLILVTAALRAEIVGVPEATFIHRLTGAPKQYSASSDLDARIDLTRNYWEVLERLLSEKEISGFQRLRYEATFVWHMQRRVAKWRPLFYAASGLTPNKRSAT